MTSKQRNFFFADLWPKACRRQGWTGAVEMEVKRRFVVLQATTALHREAPCKGQPTERMSLCNQAQLTAVFDAVKLLIDPNSLKKARAAANPAEAADADECRRLVWKIREAAKRDEVTLNDAYIQKIAAYDCRAAQVTVWTDLPAESLRRVLIHVNKRANEKDPDVQPRGPRQPKAAVEETTDYQMKPFKLFTPRSQAETVDTPY